MNAMCCYYAAYSDSHNVILDALSSNERDCVIDVDTVMLLSALHCTSQTDFAETWDADFARLRTAE